MRGSPADVAAREREERGAPAEVTAGAKEGRDTPKSEKEREEDEEKFGRIGRREKNWVWEKNGWERFCFGGVANGKKSLG